MRYPFEISQVAVQKAISVEEEAPFAIKYRNVSSKDLGGDSEGGRLLRVRFHLEDGDLRGGDVLFIGWTRDDKHPLSDPYTHTIDFMPKKSEASFSGTFAFAHPDVQPFSTAVVRASLEIGDVDAPTEKYSLVQQRRFQIQLTTKFSPSPNAEVLLLINSATTKEEVSRW